MTIDISTGGIRDRLIRDAAATRLVDSLDQLGWFDSDNRARLHWLDVPAPLNIEVPLGTISVAAENVEVDDEYELGSALAEERHIFYVDLYGWDEDSAKQAIGDVRDILRGKFPAIGCDRPILDVFDTTQDPVPEDPAFSMVIENVAMDRVRDTSKVFQQFWFVCRFDLVEER